MTLSYVQMEEQGKGVSGKGVDWGIVSGTSGTGWTFSSGVEYPCYETTYKTVKYILLHRPGSIMPIPGDLDSDGLADCTDPQPTISNNWWWVHDMLGDASRCDASAVYALF